MYATTKRIHVQRADQPGGALRVSTANTHAHLHIGFQVYRFIDTIMCKIFSHRVNVMTWFGPKQNKEINTRIQFHDQIINESAKWQRQTHTERQRHGRNGRTRKSTTMTMVEKKNGKNKNFRWLSILTHKTIILWIHWCGAQYNDVNWLKVILHFDILDQMNRNVHEGHSADMLSRFRCMRLAVCLSPFRCGSFSV